jgi:hypothetical protein
MKRPNVSVDAVHGIAGRILEALLSTNLPTPELEKFCASTLALRDAASNQRDQLWAPLSRSMRGIIHQLAFQS